MAVEDKYVNSDVAAGLIAALAIKAAGGARLQCHVVTFEVAAADDDGSVYRVLKHLNPDLVPVKFEVYNDAITGGTDYDLGLYESGVGKAVVDADVFADGLDMSSAAAKASPKDGLTTVDISELDDRLWEHAGHTISTKKPGYDLAFTANTVGSAAGTITLLAMFADGG